MNTASPPGTNTTVVPRPTTQIAIGCLAIPLLVVGGILFAFLNIRSQASDTLVVPDGTVLLVRAAPDETAPLLARFGEGRSLSISGRSADWRWLEVALWDGRSGWALRPLDILVWKLDAKVHSAPVVAGEAPHATASLSSEMIAVAATTFTMGSPPGLGEEDERPAHPVTLSAFEIDRTEVAVGQYWACVIEGVCTAPANDASQSEPHYLNDPRFDAYPMINVTWTEANHYCMWQNKRLPTEAEWEMAAGWNPDKAAKLQWPWGNQAEQGGVNIGSATIGPAGSFAGDISPVGAADLGGNVSEWVFDWYKSDYYSTADDTDPVGPSHRRGEGSGRVVRGGAFSDAVAEARTANRQSRAETYGYATVGFRCVRDR